LLAGSQPDESGAIDAYQRAIALGENRTSVYQELITLLYRRNRLAEAEPFLSRLRAADQLSPQLESLGIAIDAQQGNLQRALETARRRVQRDPKNFTYRIQLGQLLAIDLPTDPAQHPARLREAESELMKARQDAGDDPRAWSALVSFYAATQQPDLARKLLAEMEEQSAALPKDQKLFLLAQGYALVRDVERAKELFTEAVAAAPDRLEVQLVAGAFFQQADSQSAERCFRRALEISPRNTVARRSLAILLVSRTGADQDMSQVTRLLDDAAGLDRTDPDQQRIEVLLLLSRGGAEGRQQARQILESLAALPQSTPFDRLMLARLYTAQGDADAAGKQLNVLIGQENPQPATLVAYLEHLFAQSRGSEAAAARYLDQLAKVEPESNSGRTMSLRARWLKANNKQDQIQPLVESFLRTNQPKLTNPQDQARLMLLAAALYASLDMDLAAESAYQRAAKLEPTAFAAHAEWLARKNRPGEAVQLCVQSATGPQLPQVAMTLSTILTTTPVSADEQRVAEPILTLALRQHPRHVGVLFCVATLRLMQGQDAESIDLFRRALEITPNHVQTLNNLSMLLAKQRQGRKEALELLDRAIGLAGFDAELLDSKGWVLLQDNRLAEAEALFRNALSLPPGDPRHHYHLALALQQQGKSEPARQALDRAYANKLTASMLTGDEQQRLTGLAKSLEYQQPQNSSAKGQTKP
jgi:tetratricopeptide (TPR) repeat protein